MELPGTNPHSQSSGRSRWTRPLQCPMHQEWTTILMDSYPRLGRLAGSKDSATNCRRLDLFADKKAVESVRLGPSLKSEAEQRALADGISVSEVIRRAL